MVRLAVARQEILQPRHVAERRRADQHRAADAALDQADPAQDQRAHDALAEIGLGDQQRAQLLRRNQQRFDVALGMAVDQRDAAGELADLGQKLPRPLVDDRRDMAEAVALGDRDMARQHHEHAGAELAGLEQGFAVPGSVRSSPNRRMRSISGCVSVGKVCSWRGNAMEVAPVAGPAVMSELIVAAYKRTRTVQRARHATRRAKQDSPLRYWLGFSPPASSREASALSEDAASPRCARAPATSAA